MTTVAAALAACNPFDDEGPPGGGYAPSACVVDDDCTLAATDCCACPEFAIAFEDRDRSCEVVDCPPPPEPCPDLVAACVEGTCEAVCAPVTCEVSCANGFAADDHGCLTCACAEAPPPTAAACVEDVDCVQVAADCCGCARGGADTAVAATDADTFSESLMCPDDPACPEVDVCDPSAAPRCRGGRCVLEGDSDDDAGESAPTCGRPDLPTCPEGTVCVLNADPAASMEGVGSCQAP